MEIDTLVAVAVLVVHAWIEIDSRSPAATLNEFVVDMESAEREIRKMGFPCIRHSFGERRE